MALENTAVVPDFQAEYEGSIPFTRSSDFSVQPRASDFHSDKLGCFTCENSFKVAFSQQSDRHSAWLPLDHDL
jgi:hypothetical protein